MPMPSTTSAWYGIDFKALKKAAQAHARYLSRADCQISRAERLRLLLLVAEIAKILAEGEENARRAAELAERRDMLAEDKPPAKITVIQKGQRRLNALVARNRERERERAELERDAAAVAKLHAKLNHSKRQKTKTDVFGTRPGNNVLPGANNGFTAGREIDQYDRGFDGSA